jgi:hypothetical protein
MGITPLAITASIVASLKDFVKRKTGIPDSLTLYTKIDGIKISLSMIKGPPETTERHLGLSGISP